MARSNSKDKKNKLDAILIASTRVFADLGFDRASMSQVAEACKLSKASLYHYFPSKDAILFSILNNHLKALSEHASSLDKAGRNNEEFLYYLVEEILLQYRGYDDVHDLQIRALGQLKRSDKEILRNYMRVLVAVVSECIEKINPEKFKDKKVLRSTTMSLFGMLNWYYTWNSGKGVEERKNYANNITTMLLYGIKKS